MRPPRRIHRTSSRIWRSPFSCYKNLFVNELHMQINRILGVGKQRFDIKRSHICKCMGPTMKIKLRQTHTHTGTMVGFGVGSTTIISWIYYVLNWNINSTHVLRRKRREELQHKFKRNHSHTDPQSIWSGATQLRSDWCDIYGCLQLTEWVLLTLHRW